MESPTIQSQSNKSNMSGKKNIVVIGGSFGGIGVAQNILAFIPSVKVTLINTSKDWYFNIAAARILGKPNSTPLEKVIYSTFSLLPRMCLQP
jgi:NADH dehydrogenase FAD-containing subunit